jgi:hypothetical protein
MNRRFMFLMIRGAQNPSALLSMVSLACGERSSGRSLREKDV